MFQSEKVPCYLRSFKSCGDEDGPEIVAAFYVTPLTFDLCYEISDRIAKQIFRKEGGSHVPAQELGLTVLNLGEVKPQNIEMYPHAVDGADGAGRLIPSCKIGKVTVDKVIPESPDWSLIFHVTMGMDSNSLELLRKYFRKTVFITMEDTQETLFESDDKKPIILDDAEVMLPKDAVRLKCEACPVDAIYYDTNQRAWCGEHVGAAVGVQVRRIKYGDEI